MTELEIKRIGRVPVAHLGEDLDAANAAVVHHQLAESLGTDALTLVVDLSDTGYVDSAGIDMLLRLSDRLGQRRAKLILVIPESSQLSRLFALVGLPDAIAIHRSVDDALAEARSGGQSCKGCKG